MDAHIHTWMHPPSHACMHTRRHLVGSETQTYTKLLKQTQIPHYRFGFGTWYSKFLKNLKWFVDIAADRQRRCTGKTCFTVQHFEFDTINVTTHSQCWLQTILGSSEKNGKATLKHGCARSICTRGSYMAGPVLFTRADAK